METSYCQRWRERRDSYRPVGETIIPAEYEVACLPERDAKAYVITHHYSASYPAARFRYGLHRRGQLVGVAVFSVPVRPEVLTNVFPTGDAQESVELGRFVLDDGVPGNGETFFLAQCCARLRREQIAGVVSFSDPMARYDAGGRAVFVGHIGNIYQAFSATFLGRATPRTLRLLPDGSVLSDRALQKIRAQEQGARYSTELLLRRGARAPRVGEDPRAWLREVLPGLTRTVRHPGVLRYAWALHRSARRFLAGRGLPYPKWSLAA
jgi:hypothetical protein